MTSLSPSRPRRAVLGALTVTHAANDFYAGAVAALLPFLVLHAGYSYAAVAGVTLAATALSSVAQPFFGHLSDTFGLRWMSLAGLLLAGAGIAVSGIVADSYVLLCTAVALSGIGVAAYHPAATIEAREAGGGTSGAMSVFSVGGSLGVAVAPSAVILVVGSFGLPGTGLLILPAVVMGALYVKASRATRQGGTAPVTTGPTTSGSQLTATDDWRAFLRLSALLALWSMVYVGTSTFISLYSLERFDVSTGSASIALSIFPAAGAAGILAGGWLADRIGRIRVIRIGYAVAACSVAAIVLAPAPSVVIGATAVLGLSLFLPFAGQLTLSHSYLPNRIGIASGVTLGLTLSLGGLGVPLLGMLADAQGVRTVFVLLTALMVIAFVASFALRERRMPEVPETYAVRQTQAVAA